MNEPISITATDVYSVRRESLPALPLIHEHLTGIRIIESWIRKQYVQQPLRILEAGCGNKWSLKIDVPYTLTAMDIDTNALAIRKSKVRDVDEVLVGDVRDSNVAPAGSFDVVYNSFVLEHVPGAEQALDNFFRWLKPGGLLVLRMPDRDSVYGFLTRITPYWSHVMLKKYVYRFPNAGKPGYDPYPTFHDLVVSRRGIHAYCEKHGHAISEELGHTYYLPEKPPLSILGLGLVRSLSLLSLGRLDWRYNNLTLLIHKGQGSRSVRTPATSAT